MLQTLLSTVAPLLPKILAGVAAAINQPSGASAPSTPVTTAASSILQFEENFVKKIQTLLNDVENIGLVSFGGPLVVDGIAGAKTQAALQAVVAKAASFGVKLQ